MELELGQVSILFIHRTGWPGCRFAFYGHGAKPQENTVAYYFNDLTPTTPKIINLDQ